VTPCIEWTGTRFQSGYGRVGGRRAHRVAYERAHGPVPDGMLVLHTCDNPPCVNPDHLYAGTHADNMRDRMVRSRGACGERVNTAKLRAEQVYEIRARAGAGEPHTLLASDYGVSGAMVGFIVRREAWKHLPDVHFSASGR
jgi:HNH endonuclease